MSTEASNAPVDKAPSKGSAKANSIEEEDYNLNEELGKNTGTTQQSQKFGQGYQRRQYNEFSRDSLTTRPDIDDLIEARFAKYESQGTSSHQSISSGLFKSQNKQTWDDETSRCAELPEDIPEEQLEILQQEDNKIYENLISEKIYTETQMYELLKNSTSRKLQNELFDLIKKKIDTGDINKAKVFMDKLNELGSTAQINIDELTLVQIEKLFLERKQYSEEDFVTDTFIEDIKEGFKIADSVFKQDHIEPMTQESFRDPKILYDEYNEYLDLQLLEAVNRTTPNDKLTPQIILDQEIEQLVEGQPYQDEVEEFMDQTFEQALEEQIDTMRDKMMKQEKEPFDIPYLTDSYPRFEQTNEQLEEVLESNRNERQQYENSLQMKNFDQLSDYLRGKVEIDKEDAANNLVMQMDVDEGYNSIMREELKNQFSMNQILIKESGLLRQRLLILARQAKQSLGVTLRNKDKLMNHLQNTSKDQASDVVPNKIYNFIRFEKNTYQRQQELKNLYGERTIKRDSKKISDFNTEMQILGRIYELQKGSLKQRSEAVNHMFKLFQIMEQNKVKPDVDFQARLFEYAVYTKNKDMANRKLNEILKNPSQEHLGQINIDALKTFFKQSLRQDNFAGLGSIMNYISERNLNVASWPLEQFKSSLEYYLNYSPNLTNVMTFTRYYTHIMHNRLETLLNKEYSSKTIDQLNDAEKYALNRSLFNGVESLVDMKQLFKYLVDQVGSKSAVDPVTKDDLMWNLINFFTQDGMSEVQKLSQTGLQTIDESDIAKYIKNHIRDSQTFDRATKLVMRYNDSKETTLQNAILQHLREFQANNNGELPFSFEKNKLRTSYVKLKTARKQLNTKFSEKTLEYYLYLFKQQKMWPEIIDIAENFNELTQTTGESEIKQHYLSDALLRIDSNQHCHKLVSEAVYGGKDLATPGYITSMTKAYFKDGSIKHAIAFFQGKIQEIQEIKKKREDYLVDLFDSVFNDEASQQMSYEEFRERYHRAIRISEKTIRESYTVNQLQKILEEKDYDYIEGLFQYYIVDIDETNFLNQKQKSRNDFKLAQLQSMPIQDLLSNLIINEDEVERVKDIRDRKQALLSMLRSRDIETLMHIKEVMKNDGVKIFSEKMDKHSADELSQIFQIQSKEKIEEVLRRTEGLYNSAYVQEDDVDEYQQDIQEASMQYAFEEVLAKPNISRMYDGKSIRAMADLNNKKRRFTLMRKDQMRLDTHLLNQYLFDGDLQDPADPVKRIQQEYNDSVVQLKEELLEAVNERKEEVLGIALQIFNNLQDKSLKTVRLNELEDMDANEVIKEKAINQTLDKLKILLNDSTSPLYALLKTTALSKGETNYDNFNELLEEHELYDIEFDIKAQAMENEQLESMINLLEHTTDQLKEISNHLLQKSSEEVQFKKLYEKEYKRIRDNDSKHLEQSLEAIVKQHYQEYQQAFEENKRATVAQELKRDQKLSVMRDIFTLEYENQFIDNLFPAFYSQDLIIFGLENKIPEAIRLGEHMMSQNDQKLPKDIQIAVKEYLFSNSEKYQAAIKNTGPIDNQKLYRSHKNAKESPVIFSMDDEYWQDYLKTTWKRSELWKAPSYYAFMHKQNGIVGEVINIPTEQQVEKNIRYAAML